VVGPVSGILGVVSHRDHQLQLAEDDIDDLIVVSGERNIPHLDTGRGVVVRREGVWGAVDPADGGGKRLVEPATVSDTGDRQPTASVAQPRCRCS
jgi:hypothetical protein